MISTDDIIRIIKHTEENNFYKSISIKINYSMDNVVMTLERRGVPDRCEEEKKFLHPFDQQGACFPVDAFGFVDCFGHQSGDILYDRQLFR